MRSKALFYIPFCIVLIAVVIQIHEHVTNGPLKSSETGYSNAKELWSAIVVLPEIGVQNKKADAESLHEYVQVVKRIRVTKSEVVESALGMLSHNPRYPLGDVQAMLLLRMCFKCPSSIREPFRGVWLFDKSQTFNEDVNYPVGQVFGRIYLKDSIAGYSGQPYDPVKEYHWMLSNCQWRNL